MLMQEFIDRTGYTPKSAQEYMEIEGEYYNFPGDKDEFCKMWKERDQIQTRLKSCQELTERIRVNLTDINLRRMKTTDSRIKKRLKGREKRIRKELEHLESECAGLIARIDGFNYTPVFEL